MNVNLGPFGPGCGRPSWEFWRRRGFPLDELHVLGEAPHGRAALAVERDDEVLAVAARRDERAEGVVFEAVSYTHLTLPTKA